jgi:hypothetical protein
MQMFSKHLYPSLGVQEIFFDEVLSLAPVLSSVFSVNTIHFLSSFCLAMILLFSSYWPGSVYFADLELVILETCANFLQHFLADSYFIELN